jgi:diguanylate cyclase (GGDEF)-like protein
VGPDPGALATDNGVFLYRPTRLKVLVIDDDPDLVYVIKRQLELNGSYDVLTATSGEEGVQMARTEGPDLIIVDLFMPTMDGFEVCQKLRKDRLTYLVPVVVLTASGTQMDKIRALQIGADDFMSKPFTPAELEARVAGLIRRFHQSRSSNPLTGLPGNLSIEQEITKRLMRGDKLACCYLDLDNFKAFNDHYGFEKGDDCIKLVASLLIRAAEEVGTGEDFIGHIGGDDFIYISTPETAPEVMEQVIAWFDELIPSYYSEEVQQLGYMEVVNRQGVPQTFPLMTLSIGIAHNSLRQLSSALQVSAIATECKSLSKKRDVGRSTYVIDRRTS